MDGGVLHNDVHRIGAAVDQDRLWARHIALSAFGRREDGGVNRQALSREDIDGRRELLRWTDALGYKTFIDPVGNFFIRREGERPDVAPIVTGSHLDSQPAGGKFDGVFGVLAGLEVLQALDACKISTLRPVEVVVWTNEEGSRFSPGMTGSTAFAGILPLSQAMELEDAAGIRFGDALAHVMSAFAHLPKRPLGFPVAGYIEAHIEQGPVLEQAEHLVGVVSGIQGTRWFSVNVKGRAMHAGTVPSRLRRDAFKTTIAIADSLAKLMCDEEDLIRFTIGQVIVWPNSPNSIPGEVTFSIDFRHPAETVLSAIGDQIERICLEHANGCEVTVKEMLNKRPVAFPAALVSRISAIAAELGIGNMVLPSGAFHDAMSMSNICPTGMIFVPCVSGISHSPEESAMPAALAAGARVLAATILDMSLKEDML